MVVQGDLLDALFRLVVAADRRPVVEQSERVHRLIVLARADRAGEAITPGEEIASGSLFQGDHAIEQRAVRLPQLGTEDQQPAAAVGDLEAAVLIGVGDFLRQLWLVERAIEEGLDLAVVLLAQLCLIAIEMEGADQRPVAMHRRVPVESSVEDWSLLSRQLEIGFTAEHHPDVVGVLLLDAGERHLGQFSKCSLQGHHGFPSGFMAFIEASPEALVEGPLMVRFRGPLLLEC